MQLGVQRFENIRLNSIENFGEKVSRKSDPQYKSEHSMRVQWEGKIASLMDQPSSPKTTQALQSLLYYCNTTLSELKENNKSNDYKYLQNIQLFLAETISRRITKTEGLAEHDTTVQRNKVIESPISQLPPASPPKSHKATDRRPQNLAPRATYKGTSVQTHNVLHSAPKVAAQDIRDRNGALTGTALNTVGDGDCLIHSIYGEATDLNDGYGTQIRCLNPNDLRHTVSKTMLDNLGSQPVVTSLYKQWWIERLDECKELRQSAELNPREIPATTRVMFHSNEALRAFSNTTDHSLEQSRPHLDRFIMSEPAKHIFETHIKTPGTYVNNRSEMSIFALITGPIHVATLNGVEVYSPLSGRDSVSHQILDPERPQFTDQERIDFSNGIDHFSSTKPGWALQKRFVYLQDTGESHYQKFIPAENGEE